ncbi:hypothetical protein FB45DRAFT_1042430 [Roridomyces roridus]|uniref:F-box domain-containing protein n=1 Tax=Roridomyces roridus TaxID=1738132 RepID=A0AAD7AZ30_9AGAR|nr:hypothetical protein FB45DRAFT_1042430 [Roridomyces roridus]
MGLPNEDGCPPPYPGRHEHLITSNEPPHADEEGFFRDQSWKRVPVWRSSMQRSELCKRMPPEILADIFSWTLPPMNELRGDVSDLETSPWVLTQVCSRWRDISLSTPSLWCNIAAVYGGKRGEFPDPRPEMVQTQVERSGAQNLMIQFHASESHDPAEQVALFQVLASHSARWEQISIQVAAALVPHLAQLRGRVPAIQRIWLQWDTKDSEIGADSIDCFEIAPSLLDMGTFIESQYIPIVFPADQLTAY